MTNFHKAILILFGFVPLILGAQNFQITNQHGFGGNFNDDGRCVIETSDGGFIICASSSSGISGDKTIPSFNASNDIWVIKIDANGTIVWQTVYGGNAYDVPSNIVVTSDGNFIITAHSQSGLSGNKTTPGYGLSDGWIIKIDDFGNIIWQQTIGGSGNDFLRSTLELNNNLYVSIGYTSSSSSGNKPQPLIGTTDYWLVFLDGTGNIVKQQDIGGFQGNAAAGITVFQDSILFIAGGSDSDISGNKTQNTFGESDFWILKCDTVANVLKDITIGGLNNDVAKGILLDESNNLIVYGYSNSSISGNKTSTNYGGLLKINFLLIK